MSRELLKKEALARMEILKLHKNAISAFRKHDKLLYSKIGRICFPHAPGNILKVAGLYDTTLEMDEAVRIFEEKGDGWRLVYHVVHSSTEFGELFNFLYVEGNYQEEWKEDNRLLEHGMTFSYVVNNTFPDCSEFGTIGVENLSGGLIRKI
ncbi:hypothetical protein AF450_14550 [Listeria monocytogenes]|nr:hypothetical protein [Listeria monocytogenes]